MLSPSPGVGVGAMGGKPTALDALCSRPGLSTSAKVLGLPAYAVVTTLFSKHLTATYEWDALPSPELLRSTECMHNAPWNDDVMYCSDGGGEVWYGLVRFILARSFAAELQTVAVLQRMKEATAWSGSPSSAAR